MKKKLAYLLILPMLFVGLSSCGNKGEVVYPEYPEITWDEKDYICNGSAGGWFTEISVGRYLSVGRSFDFTFKTGNTRDKSFTVKSSNPNVALPTNKGDKKNFILTCNGIGDTILTIEDADEMLVYRNIIRVRKAYSLSNIAEGLYKTDKFVSPAGWESWLGSYTVTFTEKNPITGIMKGTDDYEGQIVTHNFTLKYDMYYEPTDCYCYNVDKFETTSSITTLTQIAITRALDTIYIYDGEGVLITWVSPEK